MKTPICAFDAKSGILCAKCTAKLKSGHITQADVDLSKKLTKLSERIPDLRDATLLRGLDVDGDYVLVVPSIDLLRLRRDPTLLTRLEDELGKKLWLLEGETTDRKALEDLFYPMRILTVNTVWLPDGSKLTKAIIPKRSADRFSINLEQIKKIVKLVRGIDLLVEFERQ